MGNLIGQPNTASGGSTSISGNYSQNEANRTTFATIGGLDSTLTSSTKSITGGDFEGGLTIDHRLLSEAGRNQIGKEINYSKNLAKTPFTAAYGAIKSDEDNKISNFFNATAGATIANTRLLLNQDITAQELAGDTNLIAYDGKNLKENSDAKKAYGFYDSKTDKAALNSSITSKLGENEIAGLVAHEAIGHKIGGESEFVAGFVEDAVKNNWSIYQKGNNNFQLTIPISNPSSNEYASGVVFGDRVMPALQVMTHEVAFGKSHATVVHTPEPDHQKLYAGKDGYVLDEKSGNWIRTWGAGGSLLLSGNLVSDANRSRDIDFSIKTYASPNLVPVNQEAKYVETLNRLDSGYKDNLVYDLFPNLNNSDGYNSNSYVSGLLNAAKINVPEIDLKLPGYRKPVPVENFGVGR